MSSFKQFSGDRRHVRAPEKSRFVRTCNLLSDYIKEKGSLRDFNIEIGGKIESLQDLILKYRSASTSATMEKEVNDGKSAEPLKDLQPNTPQDLSINTVVDISHTPKSKEATNSDPTRAPLTIIYSGRVLVFEDYPPEKARELMALAANTSPSGANSILNNCEVQRNDRAKVEQHLAFSNGSDLPIARRSSIHRFLEKRKDRAVGRGPYQVEEEQLHLKL